MAMALAQTDRIFLVVAAERGYLTREQAAQVETEVTRTGKTAEALVQKLGILSSRRVARLLNHVRYRSLRHCDKLYAQAAVAARLIGEAEAEKALHTQRVRFERNRERIRVGTLLLEWGLLRPDQDKDLAARVTAEAARQEQAAGSDSGPAGAENDSSLASGRANDTPRETRSRSSAIEKAEPRRRSSAVEKARIEVEPPAQMMDSAEGYEQACAQVARRRIEAAAARAIVEGASRRTAS